MRLVLDTNVLVSAVLKDSSVPALAVRLAHQRGMLLKSAATEQQLFEVVTRPYFAGLIVPAARNWLHILLSSAELVTNR